ncbi:MAG: CRISPR-associated ring nuclease Csm6 [Thiothrix sp.]|uniref:CRISPR-associated ring nuclease Csm6 n=1 Tax=Thiothrix sp. TaxID=1032 RepID=UPI002637468C|nr:CRISPR-associated ring nuclease Csm6 [Thiothrix sp.]MDD5392729.1 CRISPR-associated ring nuclease Csm6 [Thiothrix sp.]
MTTITKTKPEDFEQRILLAVAGGTPAIVTETLYALTQKAEPPYLPTEIYIITTAGVYANLQEKLLGDTGKIYQLYRDYGMIPPASNKIHLCCIGKDKRYLNDITTSEENEIAANFITDKVRKLTKEDSSLHVSIAGGRKTMTYYLGYAMSVFGRIQDCMSHVLVDDRYAVPGFYYPTAQSQIITNQWTGDSFDARDVNVMLGKLPFIRLRDGLTDDLLNDSDKSYSDIIAIAQRQLAPISVRIVYEAVVTLYCGGEEIKLPPAQLALYVWMLQRHKAGKVVITLADKVTKSVLAEEFKAVYAELSKESGHYIHAEESVNSMDTDYFGAPRTNINKKLNATLGKPKAKAYLLQSSGKKNAMQYSLSDELKPEHISFEYPVKQLKKPIF